MSFDRLARHYSWMEWVLAGRKLQLCRTAFLEEARNAREILLVGEGHGRFLTELCRVNRNADISFVDASSEMICVARERLKRGGLDERRIDFQAVPILEFEVKKRFDLVATHFFLDCFDRDELERVIGKVARFVRSGGRWIIADFQVPPGGWRKHRARMVLGLAYAFFRRAVKLRATELIYPGPYLARQGLRKLSKREFNFDLLYSELWKKPE